MVEAELTLYRKICFLSGAFSTILGVMVLLTRATNIAILISLDPHWVIMKVKTALGFGLAGAAILALLRADKTNGAIGINTELGKGSTFWFKIPCA